MLIIMLKLYIDTFYDIRRNHNINIENIIIHEIVN